MSEPTSFEQLLMLAKQGDATAMTHLVEQYEPEVRLVARARLGSALRPHLDSLDLVQSVHRSLMVGLRDDKFDISSPEKLVALAMTIVRRKVARHWRKLKRQQRFPVSQDDSQELTDLMVSLDGSSSDPVQTAAVREATEQIMNELDEVEQRMIQMRLEGYTTAEVARTLGLDPDVLRVKLSRLRRRLRDRGLLADWL